jgi:hypothetical protein
LNGSGRILIVISEWRFFGSVIHAKQKIKMLKHDFSVMLSNGDISFSKNSTSNVTYYQLHSTKQNQVKISVIIGKLFCFRINLYNLIKITSLPCSPLHVCRTWFIFMNAFNTTFQDANLYSHNWYRSVLKQYTNK